MDLRYTPEEIAFRDEMRTFFREKIPAEIRRKGAEGHHATPQEMILCQRIMNQHGLATPNWPVEWGGKDWTPMQRYIYTEEILSHDVPAPLPFNVHMVGPVIAFFGTEAQKKHYLPRAANMDDWWCQGFSEPGAGSDLASLKTRAVRDGDHYVINGQKTWTTLAQYADWCFVLARTDPQAAKPQQGISFILVDMKAPGITVRPIQTIDGGHEVNEVFFDDVRVPVENLVGAEGRGFPAIMLNFNNERLALAAGATAYARVAMQEAIEWAQQRQTFGKRLADHQVIRHKIAEMARQVNASQAYLEMTAWRMAQGQSPVADICLLKVQATQTMEFCAREALQILGGAGYMRGMKSERIYREVRVNAIGGGSEEIMRDLAARQMGI